VIGPLQPAANKVEQPIGVFDSGLGGLTVVRQLLGQLPGESIIYFGDTARVPYGNKGAETIRRFSLQIVRFLEEQGVKIIVIACNTVSSVALELIQDTTGLPVVGVIEPGARAALRLSN
jgi:glutamate racemase